MSDVRLYCAQSGEGPPLVLLHGNGESGAYFARQIEEFSRDHRVLAVDTRGHGRSPRGTAPFTLAQFANDLRELLDELGIARASLLGFSDGANIAMRFALERPKRVDRLILNGGNLHPSGVRRTVQLPIELGYRLAGLLAGCSPKARQSRELLGLMVNEPQVDPSELAAIRSPTLVIAGTRDMIREEHTRLIARSLPHATLALLPGTHFIARDEADAFNRAVRAFLKETASDDTR